MCHRLTQYGVPGAGRQTPIEPLPRFAAVAAAEHGRFAVDAGARPDCPAIHRNGPDRLVVFWMARHRKTDITDLFWHVVADALPSLWTTAALLPVESVDATMILVIPTLWVCRMDDGIMRIMAVFVLAAVLFRWCKVHRNASIDRVPGVALIVG